MLLLLWFIAEEDRTADRPASDQDREPVCRLLERCQLCRLIVPHGHRAMSQHSAATYAARWVRVMRHIDVAGSTAPHSRAVHRGKLIGTATTADGVVYKDISQSFSQVHATLKS